jgi:RecA-family ATPase
MLQAAQAKLDAKASSRAKRDAEAYTFQPIKPPIVLDAADLLRKELKPVRAVVPMWIYEGLTLLASAPKVGKSTLMLQIEVAVAKGGEFWGVPVPQAKVLMIDLETNERRLRRKLDEAGVADIEPGMLMYATTWPRGRAGVEQIAAYVDQHGIKLVVIDTWQRFRETDSGKRNAYASDYDALAMVQEVCKTRPGLAIVAVHHRRKAVSDDPIDSINGSAGLAASADAIWIMSRKGAEFTLHIEARAWAPVLAAARVSAPRPLRERPLRRDRGSATSRLKPSD